ncbi:MAG: dTMP kinase [Actinomycetes bacterium]|jgi:dTMP kinase|nr:dTMP kinase [Actinomycetes bacterium]
MGTGIESTGATGPTVANASTADAGDVGTRLKKGLFITLEGGEGAGKSTQMRLLGQRLRERGLDVLCLREPGSSPIGEAIRDVLLDPGNTDLTPMAELMLYEAARAQMVAVVVKPALDAGRVVLCDRFADSSTAYQGAGRNLGPEPVARLNRFASAGIVPDRTILLDIPVSEGLCRAESVLENLSSGVLDRMEQEGLDFHQAVRDGFLELAALDPERVRVVDATRQPAEVAERIWAEVSDLFV